MMLSLKFFSYTMTMPGHSHHQNLPQQVHSHQVHHQQVHPQQVHPQQVHHNQQGSDNLDLIQQSIAAAGVSHDRPDHPTSSSEAVGNDMGLDLDAPLSPGDDQPTPTYEEISPARHSNHNSVNSRNGCQNEGHQQGPSSSRQDSLQTPSHQNNSPGSNSVQGPSTMRDCYNEMVQEADAVLPQLGDFSNFKVNPSSTKARVSVLMASMHCSLKELGDIAMSKSVVEEQCSQLHAALVAQREVVRAYRGRCFQLFQDYEDSDDNIQELEMNRLKSELKQKGLVVSQLEATVVSKDAEIKLLQEQLRRADPLHFKSPKGKALVSSRRPYLKRSAPSRDVLMASLQTPRHNYPY